MPVLHSLYGVEMAFLLLSMAHPCLLQMMRREIQENDSPEIREPNFAAATLWFEKMTVYIDILENLQKNMAEKILERLGADMENDTNAIAISIFFVILVVIMCPLILRSFWTLTTTIQVRAGLS